MDVTPPLPDHSSKRLIQVCIRTPGQTCDPKAQPRIPRGCQLTATDPPCLCLAGGVAPTTAHMCTDVRRCAAMCGGVRACAATMCTDVQTCAAVCGGVE